MPPVERFIAGATCPKCGQMDVIKAIAHERWWCVVCGHSEDSNQSTTESTHSKDNDTSPQTVQWRDQ